MRNARKSGVRTSRSPYTTAPPSRMAPARYTARGKASSRRGASMVNVLQLLTIERAWDLLFHHTVPRPDAASVDHARLDTVAQGLTALAIVVKGRCHSGAVYLCARMVMGDATTAVVTHALWLPLRIREILYGGGTLVLSMRQALSLTSAANGLMRRC